MTGSPEHTSWRGMIARCTQPNNKMFAEYGGRGITVCARWLESFDNFFADMGSKPTPHHTIERIVTKGNYEKSNCKWGTEIEQANNKRNNVFFTYDGRTQTAAQWAREIGLTYFTLYGRLSRGWSIERAITTPLTKNTSCTPSGLV